ncbi:MAG: lytic transglycosylase domain-containing protein [Parvibaculum sp.]|nr:lytic transglycosylase domain-containing protein [Parvibaculum sp.]
MSLVQAITAPQQITAALQNASEKTGTDFSYLLKTAMRESSLNCNAKSATSSACGLFQFTEQSWLGTMKQDGGDLGLGQYADAITSTSDGRYVVTDPAARREILALRNDPEVSALMAGAYTNASKDRLEDRLGREVNGGELYIAHFLGAGGATKLISGTEQTPNARADQMFPAAAAANRSIFYNRDGSPRSVSEVYTNLVAKHRNTNGGGAQLAEQSAQPASSNGLKAGRSYMRPNNFQDFSAAVSGEDKPVQTSASVASAYSTSAYSAAASSYAPIIQSQSGGSLHGLGGRSPLTLTPDVIQMLASLDAPEAGENKDLRSEQDKRDEREERQNARVAHDDSRLMLPRGGHALG